MAWVDPRSTAQLQAAAATDQSARAALRDQGAYVDSSGVYMGQAQNPGGGGGGGAPVNQNNADVLAAFKESSGFSREQLAETKRQFDLTLAQKQTEWQRQGLPELQIKQQLANLEDQRFQETVRQFNVSSATDMLKFSSTLGGPENYFQSAAFNRGAASMNQTAPFLNALATNTAMPTFNSPGAVGATPQTIGGLAAGLTGTNPNAPGGIGADQALAQIGSIFQKGPTQLGVGSLERLDPNELALLRSGGGKLGYDVDSWLRNYSKSGVGQSTAGVF